MSLRSFIFLFILHITYCVGTEPPVGDSHKIKITFITNTLVMEPLPGDISGKTSYFVKKEKKPIAKEVQYVEINTRSQYRIAPRRKLFDVFAKIESAPENLEIILSVELPLEYHGKANVPGNSTILSKEERPVLWGVVRFFGVTTANYTVRGPRKNLAEIRTKRIIVSFTVIESKS